MDELNNATAEAIAAAAVATQAVEEAFSMADLERLGRQLAREKAQRYIESHRREKINFAFFARRAADEGTY